MKATFTRWLAGAAALASVAALAPAAFAGCGGTGLNQPAAYVTHGEQDQRLLTRVATTAFPSIVGLWTVQLYDKDEHQIDYGYMVWHDDGTEFMQSVSRAPATGNFCQGVWRQIADNQFILNHFAIAYDPNSGNVAAKINIREQVTVDPTAKTFTGHLSQDVYAPDGTTLLQHISGHTDGQQVTTKTTF